MVLVNSFYTIHNKAKCFFNSVFFIIFIKITILSTTFNQIFCFFIGFINNTTNKNRYDIVTRLFKNAGFGISEKKDMRNWLWFHIITNASMMAAASKVGSLNNLFDSTSALKEFALILRELIPLMRAKGSKVGTITNIAVNLPAGLVAFAMKLALAKGNLTREIMRSASGSENLKAESNVIFVRDTLAEARRLGIAIPQLESLDSPIYREC